jgi:hypothetical protein
MFQVYRTAAPQSFWQNLRRVCLIAALLLVFTGLQTAAVMDGHLDHSRTSDSCPICHVAHTPALAAIDCFVFSAPLFSNWNLGKQDGRLAGDPSLPFQSSRAPPVLL